VAESGERLCRSEDVSRGEEKGGRGGVREGFIEAAALRRRLGLGARGVEIDG
jgi:hypothetical protein